MFEVNSVLQFTINAEDKLSHSAVLVPLATFDYPRVGYHVISLHVIHPFHCKVLLSLFTFSENGLVDQTLILCSPALFPVPFCSSGEISLSLRNSQI